MQKDESNRPIQSTISNHICKCREEAIQQFEWMTHGGTYYKSTIELFKKRAAILRETADTYDRMYELFYPSNDISNSNSLQSDASIQLPQTIEQSEDDLNDIIEVNNSNTSTVAIDSAILASLDVNKSFTSIELLVMLNSNKKYAKKDYTLYTRKLKQSLGQGIESLADEFSLGKAISILSIFSAAIVQWFTERCNWSDDPDPRIHYKLAAFNRSLDALIFAYSSEVADRPKINNSFAYNFTQKLNKWLYNEGEGHIRGQLNPYAKERNGLVSTAVSKYSVNYSATRSPLHTLHYPLRVFGLAIYLEDYIKPIIYADSKLLDPQIKSLYFNSVRSRAASIHDMKLKDITLTEIANLFADEEINELALQHYKSN